MSTETTSGRGASPVREKTREAADTAQERAGGVAQAAREQAGGVAQSAREQAGGVVAHTQAEARDLLQELRTSLREQTQAQRDRLAQVLGGYEQELQQMVDQGGGSGTATEAVRQVAQRFRSWRQYLEGQEDVIDGLRSFARRRPGAFLLAAATAGVVAGRITRGAAAARQGQVSGTGVAGSSEVPVPDVGSGGPAYGAAVTGTTGGGYPPSATPEHPTGATGYPQTEVGPSPHGSSPHGTGPTGAASTGQAPDQDPYGSAGGAGGGGTR